MKTNLIGSSDVRQWWSMELDGRDDQMTLDGMVSREIGKFLACSVQNETPGGNWLIQENGR